MTYRPNEVELFILKTIYDRGSTREFTRAEILRMCISDKGHTKTEYAEAIEVLIGKRYLTTKTTSTKVHGRSLAARKSPITIKTIRHRLSGDALLFLSGRDSSSSKKSVQQVTDNSTPYTVQRGFEKIFEDAKKSIKIVDNYIGRQTLDYLIVASVPIQIITSSTKERGFDAALTAFQTEYPSTVEIQVQDGVFHGRFMIIDNSYYVVDHSIKDYGKKAIHDYRN